MLKETRTSMYDLSCEFVFVTRYRQSVFNSIERQNSISEIFLDIANKHNLDVDIKRISDDYIYIVVNYPPKLSISTIAKMFKGHSAGRFFKQFPNVKDELWRGYLWSQKTYMNSIGTNDLSAIQSFIDSHITEYNGGRPRT